MYWFSFIELSCCAYYWEASTPCFHGNAIAGFFGMLFSLIGCRVMFELIMVAFKNNEYLRRIAENSCKKTVE
ncbi:DUF4282 domain-containing protein [Hafnia alvei]|uniref:DUF4282 domain-containing protein n=1 Tax=Hafnia alvei TaxID=569 RepID=UPI0036F35946